MANTWDERGRLGDTIADRQTQRARETQREMREQQFKQDSLDYWNRERSRQNERAQDKKYKDHMNREYHQRNK